MSRPLCICCGKPIPKRTETYFVRDADRISEGGATKYVLGPLYSKADCQRHTNGSVTAVHYWPVNGERRVYYFSAWDGESYADEYFCKGSCATRFAYVMARAGRCTNLYNEAVSRQREAAA